MPEKSHLKILSVKHISEIKDFHYNYGFDSSKVDEDITPKNYFRLATSFKADLERLSSDIDSKYKARVVSIEVPYDIDYIQIMVTKVKKIITKFDLTKEDLGFVKT